jgi:hypothetical protein
MVRAAKKTGRHTVYATAGSPTEIALLLIAQKAARAMVSATTRRWNVLALLASWVKRATRKLALVVVTTGVVSTVHACATVASEETTAPPNCAQITVVPMVHARVMPGASARMASPEKVALLPLDAQTAVQTMETACRSQGRRKGPNASATRALLDLPAKWKFALVRPVEKCAQAMDPATTRNCWLVSNPLVPARRVGLAKYAKRLSALRLAQVMETAIWTKRRARVQ